MSKVKEDPFLKNYDDRITELFEVREKLSSGPPAEGTLIVLSHIAEALETWNLMQGELDLRKLKREKKFRRRVLKELRDMQKLM